MLTLSVDPSLHSSGWCLLRDETPIDFGVVCVKSRYTGDEALALLAIEVRRLALNRVMDALVLEAPYVGKCTKTALTLGKAAGVWIGCVVTRSIQSVSPSVWGAAYTLPKHRDDRKAKALFIAQSLAPRFAWTEDSADAYLLGLYAVRESKVST